MTKERKLALSITPQSFRRERAKRKAEKVKSFEFGRTEVENLNLNNKLIQCNICGYPNKIKIWEEHEKKGRVQREVVVGCLTHHGVHPALWNLHPEHTKYRKALAVARVNSGKVN